jgi:hypothetical protein
VAAAHRRYTYILDNIPLPTSQRRHSRFGRVAGHAEANLLKSALITTEGGELMGEAIRSKLCGLPFDGSDLERVRWEILAASPPLRSEFA